MAVCVPGQYVGIHSLTQKKELNGCRGVVVGAAEEDRWCVQVCGSKNLYKVKCENLFMINDAWLQEARHFDWLGMLTHFQAPGSWNPPSFSNNFKNLDRPPTREVTEEFWGKKVYPYMWDQLDLQKDQKRGSRKKLGTLWNFEIPKNQIHEGLVFTDGSKATQESSPAGQFSLVGHCWWPVLLAGDLYGSGQLVAYCQAQALNGGRPWQTHPSRVFVFFNGPAPPPETPGVVIEEIFSDEEPEDEAEAEETPGVVIEEIFSDEKPETPIGKRLQGVVSRV